MLLMLLFTTMLRAQVPVYVQSVSDVFYFTELAGKSYFIARGNELWSTDGSTANTQSVIAMGTSSANIFCVNGSKMYIRASKTPAPDGTDEALWVSDGTANGTVLISAGFKAISQYFLPVGNQVFFLAEDATHGYEWWVTDGTAAGTHLTKDINPGMPGQDIGIRHIAYHNKMYFIGYTQTGEMDFWVSDGTEAGTYMLTESDYPGAVPLDYDMIIYHDKIYFTFHDRTNGIELWVSDGTASGTHILKNCNTGSSGTYPTCFNLFNDRLLFIAYNGNDLGSQNLWSTDGTEENTLPIKRMNVSGLSTTEWVLYNGAYYFDANMDGLGLELCVTDGTTAGTHPVKDIRTGTVGSFPDRLTVANNKLFFFASDGSTGTEPWVTDGTAAGTMQLKDIFPGTSGSMVGNYGASYAIGNKVYFVARIAANNLHLYASDGTAAGTVAVAPANATVTFSPLNSGFGTLYKSYGALYFEAKYTGNQDNLYRIGTPSLGVESINSTTDVKLYPNPAKDFITIEYATGLVNTVTIYNTLGQQVHSENLQNAHGSATVNVSKLQPGYYFVEVGSGSGKSVFKILKN